MQQYLLSPHVHFCLTDDHAVLLDLRRDKYIGVGPHQVKALAACVKGWPGADAAAPVAAPEKSLAQMLESELLTTDATVGKEARPITLPRPESTLTEPELQSRPRPGLRQTANFFRARIVARLLLKSRSIESVVARVQGRKARATSPAMDATRAQTLVESFLYLRPLLFGTRDECLYDSLSLVEFLSYYGLYPTWVFGVQTRPFLAHSWVQDGAAILNDSPEYVRRFTPILAI